MQHMWDTSGWVKITCGESDRVRDNFEHPFVVSSLTRMEGRGPAVPAVVFTEWADGDPDTPLLRDYRFPGTNRLCEHFAPETTLVGVV